MSTPGPFSHRRNHLLRKYAAVANPHYLGSTIGRLRADLDGPTKDEIVELLNKGTHYDAMLEALKEAKETGFGERDPTNRVSILIRDAIANAQGETS